jgi:hypothetical protein
VKLPDGTAHVPSALRKFVVPPPDEGAKPCSELENGLRNAVRVVAV